MNTDTTERRGPGRPPSDNPKQVIAIRIDVDTIERFRATGPGWATRMAAILEAHAPRPRREKRGRR